MREQIQRTAAWRIKVGAEIFEPDYRVVAESARQQQEDARSRKECPVAMRMNFIT
jgi:hypothetical protein